MSKGIDFEQFNKQLTNKTQFKSQDPFIIFTEDYPLPGETFDVKNQIDKVKSALEIWSEQVVVIGMRSDYELESYSSLSTYICAYSSRIVSANAIVKLLLND